MSRRPGATYRSEEWKRRVSAGLQRYHQRRRHRERVLPVHLRMLEQGDPPEALSPLLAAAEAEHGRLLGAVGGPEASSQRNMVVADVVSLRLMARALMIRFWQTGDPDLASRAGTLFAAARSGLALLGLDERREEIDLRQYVEAKTREAAQGAAGAAKR